MLVTNSYRLKHKLWVNNFRANKAGDMVFFKKIFIARMIPLLIRTELIIIIPMVVVVNQNFINLIFPFLLYKRSVVMLIVITISLNCMKT